MPLTAAGELKIQAVADLGGLGDKDGAPVVYHWTLPNLIHPLLPGLAVLALLLVPRNRCGSAWWIWIPLLAVVFLAPPLVNAFSLPSELADVIGALAYGLAATWLLAPFLARRHRFLSFLCILPTLAAFSVLTYLFKQDWGGVDTDMVFRTLIAFVFGVPVIAFALFLTGWICRQRYRPAAVTFWFAVALFGIWLVVTAPFFVITMIASSGEVPWSTLFIFHAIISGVSFALTFPFLVLAFANSLFRDRLKGLLNLEETPPVPPPVPHAAATPACG